MKIVTQVFWGRWLKGFYETGYPKNPYVQSFIQIHQLKKIH